MKLEKIIDTLKLHFSRADITFNEIKTWKELTFGDEEKIINIDSFIFRYSKIQDIMNEKFFSAVLTFLEEYKPNMSLIDVLNKLEKLELIPSAEEWREFRKLRNILVHEYPDNEIEIIEGIQFALKAFVKIKKIFAELVIYLEARKIS